MAPEVELRSKLATIGRRLRWLTIEERLSWCLLPGLAAALALLAAHKLDRLDDPYPLMGLAVGVSAALGLAWGLSRRVSLFDAASLADRTLELKERLSNAVVFAERPEASPLVPALVADAARHAEGLLPTAVLPYHPSRPARWSLFAAALVAAAWLAPTFAIGRTPGEVAVRQEMREQGQRLRQVADKAREQAQGRQLQKPEELAKRLEKLARELEKAKLSKKEALLKSGKLAAELREAQKLAALQSGSQGMGRVAEALRNVGFETPAVQDIARAAREQRADEMASKIAKLAQELRQGKLKSPAEREKLAEDLQQMAEAAEAGGMGEMAQALREAASAVKQGKDTAAAEAMERAAKAANDAAQGAAENQTLEQMAQELQQSQQEVADADQQQAGNQGQGAGGQGQQGQGSGGQGQQGQGSGGQGQQGQGAGGQGSQGQQSGGQNGAGAGQSGASGMPGGTGQGGGKGKQPPGGKAGSFAGHGSTNEEQQGNAMPPYMGEPKMQDPGKRPNWEEAYKSIYAPERTDVQTEDTKFRGQVGRGREQTAPVRGAPERQPSTAPYYEVYEAYAQDAEDAMAREDIPRPYQRQVRDYFRAIQPDRGGSAK